MPTTSNSEAMSREEVGSSKMKTLGFRLSALALFIL